MNPLRDDTPLHERMYRAARKRVVPLKIYPQLERRGISFIAFALLLLCLLLSKGITFRRRSVVEEVSLPPHGPSLQAVER